MKSLNFKISKSNEDLLVTDSGICTGICSSDKDWDDYCDSNRGINQY